MTRDELLDEFLQAARECATLPAWDRQTFPPESTNPPVQRPAWSQQ